MVEDLREKDTFLRNNIPERIRQFGKSNKFIIIFNIQCERDIATQAIPFMEEMGMDAVYGITTKDNILMWLYDCEGLPDPHKSFETRSIYLFIDSIAKKFYEGKLSLDDKEEALILNECWHDIFKCRKELMILEENNSDNLFIFDEKSLKKDLFCIMDQGLFIPKKDTNYNYYRFNFSRETAAYSIMLSGIRANYKVFSIGIYDFDNRVMLYKKDYNTNTSIHLNFILKDNSNIGLCIYAGPHGETARKEMYIGRIKISMCQLVPLDTTHYIAEFYDGNRLIDTMCISYGKGQKLPKAPKKDKEFLGWKTVRKSDGYTTLVNKSGKRISGPETDIGDEWSLYLYADGSYSAKGSSIEWDIVEFHAIYESN